MNELILNKLAELEEKGSLENALRAVEASQQLSFTPVSLETFKVWCDNFKVKMMKMKEELKSDRDLRLTGRQIFEQKKNIIEDIKIGEDEDDEDFKDDGAGDDDDEDDDDE
jgi:hypothetical protein